MILRLENGTDLMLEFDYLRSEMGNGTRVVLNSPLGSGYSDLRGFAFCHPNDPFVKAIGRKVALARAIKNLPRNIRRQIWKAYFEFVNNAGK